MKLAGLCFLIIGILLAFIILVNNYSTPIESLDGIRNSVEELKKMAEAVKNCSIAIAVLIIIAGISLILSTNVSNKNTSSSYNDVQKLLELNRKSTKL